MMLFGAGQNRHQDEKRGGLFDGSLWGMTLAGAGMLALRWWRNRRSSASSEPAEAPKPRRNPIDGWQ
jgi:hypothetical protein